MSGPSEYFIGLMSGTSMDGVDAVLADFAGGHPRVVGDVHLPYPPGLAPRLLALQTPGGDGDALDESLRLSLMLGGLYADAVDAVLARCDMPATAIRAVGCHGQTVRHAPQLGYTLQLNAPALLAERCAIDVVADFRSRDLAAGGQGAPLVPAVHAGLFATSGESRVILNLGGIANLTRLDPARPVIGFDTGPANMLLDAWCHRHTGRSYDQNGDWAASGRVDGALLQWLLADPYFAAPAPKSTGRDLFSPEWLDARLSGTEAPADVQATLAELTAASVADAILACSPDVDAVFVCGGGAFNRDLMDRLARRLTPGVRLEHTGRLGVPPQQVEALAFAWLARACLRREPGNLPGVTGAAGPRVLGAIYPAM